MALHFRPMLTVFSALAFAALISLGVWQLHRLEWKEGLIAKTEARTHAEPIAFDEATNRISDGEDLEYQPVRISGEFRYDLEAKVFGVFDGVAGAYLFTPLVHHGRIVYVNRGFAPQDALESGDVGRPQGEVEITGLLRYPERPKPPASWFQPKGQSADGLWFIRDPLQLGARNSLDPVPYYVDSFASSGAKWPKGGTTQIDFPNNHFQYALTWFGLAAALLGVWLAYTFQS